MNEAQASSIVTSVTKRASQTLHGEFDPGSGRTLAACLIHASRAQETDGTLRREGSGMSGGRVSNT